MVVEYILTVVNTFVLIGIVAVVWFLIKMIVKKLADR